MTTTTPRKGQHLRTIQREQAQPTRRESQMLSLAEAADVLGLGRSTAYEAARATGELAGIPVVRLTARRYGVSRAAVDALVKGGAS